MATAEPSATAVASATPAATATPDPLASPEPDGQLALSHVRKLAEEIGPRTAGTPGETAARDYIRVTLESYGYDVSLQEFAFDASAFLPARVDAGQAPGPADTVSVGAIAFKGSASGSVAGPLVVVGGVGAPADFPAEVRGAVALIERGQLTFAEKAANAAAAGAAALIISNTDETGVIGDLGSSAAIPVVGIAKSDGAALVARAAAAAQMARVTVTPPQGTAYNVVAKPAGVTRCTTVTGGHYDSVPVTGGADDDASGTASVIETARVVAARRTAGANCFVLFSAEEFGLFGSKAFVEQLGGAVDALRVMVNLDLVGRPERLTLIGDADMIETARAAAQRLGIDAVSAGLPRGVGSDHLSFQNAGVPVVMLFRDDPQIHTPQDSIERIAAASLRDTVAVAAGVLATVGGP